MTGAYVQLGFVSNDFDQAIERFGQEYGIGAFKEMRDLTIGARGGRDITAHFALAFKADTQFEIIAPISGDVDFYNDVLPRSEAFAVRFHHIGRYFPNTADYRRALAEAKARWKAPVEVDIFGGSYVYLDARRDLGHYLEMYTFPPETHFEGVPRY